MEWYLNTARGVILAGLAGLALGLFLLAQGWWEVERARAWPEVAGRVSSTTSESERRHAPKSGNSWTFRPVVNFRYEVAGVEYLGRQAWLGHWPEFSDEAPMRALLDGFPDGMALTVRHDPADPSRAAVFLAPDWTRGMLFWMGGAVFLGLGLAMRVIARRPD